MIVLNVQDYSRLALSLLSENKVLYYIEVFALAVAVYVAYRYLKPIYLCYRLGAVRAPRIPQSGIFNSRPALVMLKHKQNGTLIEFLWNIFNGDNETYSVLIGGDMVTATIDPENIKAVLATQFNDFALGVRHSHFKPMLGDGIFTLDYTKWKHSRALLRPNFSREKIAHTQALESHTQHLFRHIRKHKGQPFNIQEYFYRLTVDTATEFLFGQSVHGLLDESIGEHPYEVFEGQHEFYNAFNESQEICATRAWLQKWYWIYNPKRFATNNKIVHNFADYYVNMALNMSADEVEKASGDGYVFLYELVKETRDPKLLRDQLLNIMIAGRDTTASLMTFTMFELAKNPEIFRKLKEEVHERFGAGEDARTDDMTFETLKKCTTLKNIITEVLRMYPSVPVNYRFANKHTTLPRGGGEDGNSPVFVAKGECVGYLVSSTHRNPKYYGKDAHDFKPERWEDKNLKPGWAYLPFNGGPRICLGQQFAITEASYIIARLVQQFPNIADHDPEVDTYPPRMVSQLTNTLAAGCWISLSE